MLDFKLATWKKHILGVESAFWLMLHKNPSKGLGCSELEQPRKLTRFVRKVTNARKRNPWTDRDELLHRCRGPR